MDDTTLMLIAAIVVGFIAQMVDGAMGMAYGVTSNSFLLSLGVSPALASASVHAAEVFTTGVSGISHWRLGNVNRDLFQRLLIPGVIGGVIGAYLLTEVPSDIIKPLVSLYLLLMGARIIYKALRKDEGSERTPPLIPLGFVGGLLDAIGGGGWGPVVTTTLVANGHTPRFAIGSVNLAEFFVTLAESITFVLTLGAALGNQLALVAGLIVGGLPAAPLAAVVSRRLAPQKLMLAVGALIIFLSIRTLVLALGG
ncbi:MAG: sulfite exporter TauE/SafE family protein [Anaerolineae bacterium]|nr:sulfite exporter TauE/SafE family protein [Anaerolineae bacterium]